MHTNEKTKNKSNKIGLTLLYKDYVLRIYRYMFARARHKEIAEDLASACILKIVQNKDKIEVERNINAWIFTIAHNVLVDYYKGRRQFEDLEKHESKIVAEDNVAIDAEKEFLITEVLNCLHKLKAEEREIIELTFFAELKADEIASIVKRPSATIRTMRHRAIKKLRSLLANKN